MVVDKTLSISDIKFFWQIKNQLIAVLCANVGVLSSGCGIGWLSPALGPLQSEESPLDSGPINLDEASWLGALLNVGGAFGVLCLSWCRMKFGCRIAICLSALPLILSWIMVIFGTHIAYLYVCRVAIGFSAGGQYLLIPLMVTEISDERIRGIFGLLITLLLYFGILISYLIGTFVPYSAVPYIMLVFPVVFLCCMVFFVPESPQFLLSKNKEKEAKTSLRFYKNYSVNSKEDNDQLQIDLDRIQANNDKQHKASLMETLKDFLQPDARYGLKIGITLMTLFVFNGTFVFLAYASNIFTDTGTDMDENISSIIIATIQIMGSIVSMFLVDTVGRRLLLIVSSTGCTIGLTAMGIHSYCAVNEMNNINDWYWVPVTSLSLTYFFACTGLMPLGFVIIAEVLPVNLRLSGTTFCLFYLNVLLFIVTKIFPLMEDEFYLYTCMWIFAAACFLGIIFSVMVVKETMGKDVN